MSGETWTVAFLVFISLFGFHCGGQNMPKARPKKNAESSRSVSNLSPSDSVVWERVEELFPKVLSIQKSQKPFPHQIIYGPDKTVLGYEVESDSAGTTKEGFSGPVPVRVFLDTAAIPVGIDILENEETPSYLELVRKSDLLFRLLKYQPGQPDTVDAVTLATSSSSAIIKGVTGIIERVSKEILRH
ncbi:hypothetical protein CH330_00730 [candidate division WOR-3 bacterium JGI_Cruoil_03_51_56]|uniref:FMN-binding domain-containing protein n=1 Tax=candidate division WOR-3 bacterium JGI_Cruoil_03_51_56 TaxID=1973747 RepID=A0A235BXS1_UNCW3|nr:MAG: hypothetical protein CH330_00730 [candidate division WOR-3 bacterium JGI_Cruoil_03_51_56]